MPRQIRKAVSPGQILRPALDGVITHHAAEPARHVVVGIAEIPGRDTSRLSERRIGRDAPDVIADEPLHVPFRTRPVGVVPRFEKRPEIIDDAVRRGRHEIGDACPIAEQLFLPLMRRRRILQHRAVRLGIKHSAAAAGIHDGGDFGRLRRRVGVDRMHGVGVHAVDLPRHVAHRPQRL